MLMLCIMASGQPVTEAAPPSVGATPAVTLTAEGLSLEWRAESLNLTRRADGTTGVDVPGYTLQQQPGTPRLPFASHLIALPPEGTPTVHALIREDSKIILPGRVLYNAPASDGAFASLPTEPIELRVLGVVRGVRLARLTFYPLSLNAQTWRFTTHIQVEVRFNTPAPLVPSFDSDTLVATVRALVVNPTQIQTHINSRPNRPFKLKSDNLLPPDLQSGGLQIRREQDSPKLEWFLYNTVGDMAAIEVNAPGLTTLTAEALSAIGFPVTTTNPANVRLTRAGSEIAMQWEGDVDAVFESGERFIFFAAPRFSRWTPNDVYFLSAEAVPGLRMTTRSADPTGLPAGFAWVTQTIESNALYTPQCYCGQLPAGRDGDHWVWNEVTHSSPTRTYAFETPTVAATQPATLTVWLFGYTDVAAAPDHRVDVLLNNLMLGRVEWDGKQAITTTLPITPGLLLSGSNVLTLTQPGLPGIIVEGAWLDAFEINYARGNAASGNTADIVGPSGQHAYTLSLTSTVGLRAYDVTTPDQPIVLTDVNITSNTVVLGETLAGGPYRYAVSAEDGLRAPAQVRWTHSPQGVTGADYVIITHPTFAPALTDLIALRQTQGLTVIMEDVLAIYDSFGEGRPDPQAIRAYLEMAYQTWSPRPTYVLLVGDGTFDPRPYRATSTATFIPPYLADVDPWMGETAADNRYVTVDGTDSLPDMLIGRLPVNTLTETQTLVDKIVAYETAPYPGGWNGKALWVADDADSAGDFAAESDLLAATYITAPFSVDRVYLAPPTTTLTAAYPSLLNNWNMGAGLLMYTGHSSIHQWAAERLFHNDDVVTLFNGSRLPIVLEMTCFTSTFHDPASVTLDEALVRHPSGGAIATWGATGFGVATGHHWLASGFMQSVYSDGQTEIGAAALAGKLALAGTGQNFDLLDTFTLLGDPALPLNTTIIPWAASLLLPVIRR